MGTGPVGLVFGENSFYQQTWGTRLGGRHVAKRIFDTRVANPKVKVQVRDLVRVVCIVTPLPHGGHYSGKIRFIEPQGVNGHRRPVPGAPSSGTPWESQAGTGPCGDCRRVLSVPGTRGQYSGNPFYRETWGTRGLPCC